MTPLTVVLLAHGSPDPRHRQATQAVAARLEERTRIPVAAAYLQHHPPTVSQVVGSLRAPSVLPLLLSAGAHWARDVRAALRAIEPTPPLIEPPAPEQLAAAVVEAVRALGDDVPAVVLAVAGSRARDQSERFWPLADAVARSLGTPCAVAESPAAISRVASEGAVVVPMLTSPGFLDDRIREEALRAGATSTQHIGSTSAFFEVLSALVMTTPPHLP